VSPNPTTTVRSRIGMAAAALLLLANILVPLGWGDVYPFTSAPMFREAPIECCQYRVLVDGQEQPASDWCLQRIYDGNPFGYGVGIKPPSVLEQAYGVIHDEPTVRVHIQRQYSLPQHQRIQRVEVIQDVLGATGQTVGIVRTNRWTIERVHPPTLAN
jgi:hypothetical protein